MTAPDPELLLDACVQDALAGSGMAFTELWEILSPAVAGYVRGRGVRDVDDVTSEVFLAALRHLDGFTGDGAAFRRWLFTIAHHRAVDAVRHQVRSRVEEPYNVNCDPRTTRSAESEAIMRSDHAEVMRLIQTLADDQRDVLLLRVVADLPVQEVSAALGRSREAVRQLHHRALTRLRAMARNGSVMVEEA